MRLIKYFFVLSVMVFMVFGSGVHYLQTKGITYETERFDVKPLPTLTNNEDVRCIVTVKNQKYDVSFFKTRHEGGDVFRCGSDMTKQFESQHPDSFLRKIEKYKIK